MTEASIGGKGAKPPSADTRAARAQPPWFQRYRRRAPAIVAAVGMVVVWHLIVTGFEIPTYIAPSPWQVLQVFAEFEAAEHVLPRRQGHFGVFRPIVY